MARFFRVSLLLAAAFMFVTTAAFANIPDPELSDVPEVLSIVPETVGQPLETYTVTVVGQLGPVNGAQVELQVNAVADALICWCPGQAHPVISGVSDAQGEVDFTVLGGGCVLRPDLGVTVATVRADAVPLGNVEINSPDVVNGSGAKATDPGYEFDPIEPDPNAPEEPAVCVVSLADATFHSVPIVDGSSFEKCTNFGAPFDDVVSSGDAVSVTPYIVNSSTCGP